jgi:hypothetical protein
LLQPLVGCRKRCLNRLLDLVEALAGDRLIGGVHAAQASLRRLELPAFRAKEFDAGRFERLAIARGLKCRTSSRAELIELGEKIP